MRRKMSRISFDNGFTFKDASELMKNEVDLAWSLRDQLDATSREELDRTTKSEQYRHIGVPIYWTFYKTVFENCRCDLVFDAFENFHLTVKSNKSTNPYRIGYYVWGNVPNVTVTVSSNCKCASQMDDGF